MNLRKNIVSAIAVGAILFSQFAAAFGQTEQENSWRLHGAFFGLHSLGANRMARLNVVNAVLTTPPEPDRTCQVTLVFDVYAQVPGDGSVRVLRFLRRESRNATLAPGEAISFDFPGQAADGSVLVAATAFAVPSYNGQPVAIISTLEILQGRRTLFTLPATQKYFDPQPEPPV